MVLNRQSRLRLDLASLRAYARKLSGALRLGRRDFNVCFVDDRAMRRLNAAYRRKPHPTDVLSFPWAAEDEGNNGARRGEFESFLGDVVVSTETARRNARSEGHPVENEIRWLILHGVLHLLGYDHATDNGEMTELEQSLRCRLSLREPARRRRIPRQAVERHG